MAKKRTKAKRKNPPKVHRTIRRARIKKTAKRSQPSRKASARRRKVLVTSVRRSSKSRGDKKKKKVKKPAYAKKASARRRKKNVAKKAVVKKVEGFSAESLFRAKIKVIGVGGGGGSIVSEIGRSLGKATFVIADTDIRALKKKSGIKYFWFGEELTHGLGTGVDVELAKKAADSAKEKISAYFKDQDIIIFVASLGGGLGSGATQVFAEAAKKFGGITLGIFTLPFKFEGKNKYRIAQNALKSLRQFLNVSLVIPNEKIFKVVDQSTPITNAFSTVNKSLIESLESLIDLIYNPGIINIDFADLRTILKGRGNSAFLNTVEESGKDRVEKICGRVFKNPLLQNSNFKAEKILFNIEGSESLSMFEVEKISSHIASLNPKAKIIFGISKNPKLKNKIKTTVLMTGGQIGEEKPQLEKVKEEPVKKERKITKKSPKTPVPEKNPVSFIPILKAPVLSQPSEIPVIEQKKVEVAKKNLPIVRQAIRRSGLEIKKAEELQEKKRIAQEKEWEIPAFLRRVKIKS